MEAGDMIGATLQSITWQGLVYDWHTQRQGNASLYNTGLVEGDIPVIGPGDVLPASIIPETFTRTHFVIPANRVGGSATQITLTTGENLSAIPHGATFWFQPESQSASNVNINVDGLGSRIVQKSDTSNGLTGAQARDLFPRAQVVYDSVSDVFYLQPGISGTAAKYNAGTGQDDIPVLGPGGRFVGGRMASSALNGLAFNAAETHLQGQQFGGGNTQLDLAASYAKRTGTTFTGATAGIDPVLPQQFVTLAYFDANNGGPPGDNARPDCGMV